MSKEYQVTVYRTVQQSAIVYVETDRELNASEREYISNKAEMEAYKLPDYEWKTEEVDDVELERKIFAVIEE